MKINSLQFIPVTDSTNNALARLVADNKLKNNSLSDFFALYTDYQTFGRGEGQNKWQSNRGENILLSLYFIPPLPPSQQFEFNRFFSLTVRKTLANYIPGVKIKWPNDIYVNDKKIAGILIEHYISGDTMAGTIAGVGININQTLFDPLLPNPTSLKLETGSQYDIISLIHEMIDIGENIYYSMLINRQYNLLKEEYLEHLYHINEMHWYDIKGTKTEARIIGTNDFGQLLLEDRQGLSIHAGLKR
jgi:BirA family biotin operon repressor/biotin-[acetyl-CoA-carboxylase] ligase